jgi:hypothetical protein
LLHHGKVLLEGDVNTVVNKYMEVGDGVQSVYAIHPPPDKELLPGYATSLQIEDLKGNLLQEVPIGANWRARIQFKINRATPHFIIGFGIVTMHDLPFRTSWTAPINLEPGTYEALFVNDDILLTTGNFNLVVGLSSNEIPFHYVDSGLKLNISEISHLTHDKRIVNANSGLVINPMKANINQIN